MGKMLSSTNRMNKIGKDIGAKIYSSGDEANRASVVREIILEDGRLDLPKEVVDGLMGRTERSLDPIEVFNAIYKRNDKKLEKLDGFVFKGEEARKDSKQVAKDFLDDEAGFDLNENAPYRYKEKPMVRESLDDEAVEMAEQNDLDDDIPFAQGGLAGQLHMNEGGRVGFANGGALEAFRSGLYSANQVDEATGNRLYGGNIENLFSQYKANPSNFFYADDDTQGMYDRFNTASSEYMKDFDIDSMRDPFAIQNSDQQLVAELEKLRPGTPYARYEYKPEEDKKTLFVWPEGVFTGYNFQEIKQYKNMFENAFSDNHLIIFGVNTIDDRQIKNQVFNSLVIVNNKLDVLFEYDKIKLVPFGEFLPFENILKKIGLKKITEGHTSFTKGKKTNIFIMNELKLLSLICYEVIFPELSLGQKQKNLIVNITEDAWFGETIGPSQHLAKAIFRSLENNVFLIRSANKGFSVFIDNKGIVKKILNPTEIGVIELNVPFINSVEKKYRIDLIFFILLLTCVFVCLIFNKNEKK
jgi:predicted amidohydrolase